MIKEFKRSLNARIRKKLIESKYSSKIIENWYERAMALDYYWRQSRVEEMIYRRMKKQGENKNQKTNNGEQA